jgi:hypothetical protein
LCFAPQAPSLSELRIQPPFMNQPTRVLLLLLLISLLLAASGMSATCPEPPAVPAGMMGGWRTLEAAEAALVGPH